MVPDPAAPGQVAQHRGQVHFRVSGLETVPERCSEQALGLGLAHRLGEEVGIAAEVLGRLEAIALTRCLTTACPAAGNAAILCASELTKSPSFSAGKARLIQPYRSASSAS